MKFLSLFIIFITVNYVKAAQEYTLGNPTNQCEKVGSINDDLEGRRFITTEVVKINGSQVTFRIKSYICSPDLKSVGCSDKNDGKLKLIECPLDKTVYRKNAKGTVLVYNNSDYKIVLGVEGHKTKDFDFLEKHPGVFDFSKSDQTVTLDFDQLKSFNRNDYFVKFESRHTMNAAGYPKPLINEVRVETGVGINFNPATPAKEPLKIMTAYNIQNPASKKNENTNTNKTNNSK